MTLRQYTLALLAVVILAAGIGPAGAQRRDPETPPAADRERDAPGRPVGDRPAAPEPAGPPPPPPVEQRWLDSEISAALATCARTLGDIIDAAPIPPIRDGVCGAPAPVSFKGLRTVPAFAVRPSATMTCPLAAAIERWMDEVVTPRAKALLDANVIRIENASAYVCRTRYNDPMQQMSQHAFAAALDIGAFLTAKGERISVLDHFYAPDERGQFLREVHKGACGIFGTVLGPDANAAHKNHFHFDMTPRRSKAYCQ